MCYTGSALLPCSTLPGGREVQLGYRIKRRVCPGADRLVSGVAIAGQDFTGHHHLVLHMAGVAGAVADPATHVATGQVLGAAIDGGCVFR